MATKSEHRMEDLEKIKEQKEGEQKWNMVLQANLGMWQTSKNGARFMQQSPKSWKPQIFQPSSASPSGI